jgi:hypothetical protein
MRLGRRRLLGPRGLAQAPGARGPKRRAPGQSHPCLGLAPAAGMLLEAAARDDLQLLEQALLLGADPEQGFQGAGSAFMVAAASGSIGVLRRLHQLAPQLLNRGDDEQQPGAWPLQLAVAGREAAVVAQLLDWGAACGSFPASLEGGRELPEVRAWPLPEWLVPRPAAQLLWPGGAPCNAPSHQP